MASAGRINIQNIYDVTVATVDDTSVIDPAFIEQIRVTLFELIDKKDRKKLILDLTKVRHLSSAALGVLIPLQEKYKNARGKLVLVGVNEDIQRLFAITRLDKLLTLAETEDAALKLLGAKQKQ